MEKIITANGIKYVRKCFAVKCLDFIAAVFSVGVIVVLFFSFGLALK